MPGTMAPLPLFHHRECPGNDLRANVLRARDYLEICIPLVILLLAVKILP